MKKIISISEYGSIRVLGVPIGSTTKFVKESFSDYDVKENNNCIYFDIPATEETPELSIVLSKRDDNWIDKISIRNTHLNQSDCNNTFNYFKKELNTLTVISKDENINCLTLVLSNILHKVSLLKQKGLGDNKNWCPFIMNIQGRMFNKDDAERDKAIRELYFSKEMKLDKSISIFQIKFWIKAFLVAIVLIIAYLFALNGRYSHVRGVVFFDKWEQKCIRFNIVNE